MGAWARMRDPQGWLAPMMAVQSLSQKWSGSHEEMFAFAREVADGEPEGSPLHAAIPLAHLERWLYFSMDGDERGQRRYFGSPAVQAEVQRAWTRGPRSPAFKPGPFAATQQALFAFAFGQGDDVVRAREAFDRLGGRVTQTPWSHLGAPVEAFKRMRADVYED